MVFILIALIALFGIITPSFLKVNSLMTILRQVSMIAIAGIGGGLVIIAGGIDISCGSVMSFSTIIAAYLMVNMNGSKGRRLSYMQWRIYLRRS